MNVENCIEAQYRELMECSEPNAEYADLYKAFTHPHLREILTTLHHDLILLFKRMNDRLPTGECEAHFWADESRELIRRLDIINGLFGALKGTPLAQMYLKEPFKLFTLDEYTDIITNLIEYIPKDVVIHRLTGDGPKDILIEPNWILNKRLVLNTITRKIREKNIVQGRLCT